MLNKYWSKTLSSSLNSTDTQITILFQIKCTFLLLKKTVYGVLCLHFKMQTNWMSKFVHICSLNVNFVCTIYAHKYGMPFVWDNILNKCWTSSIQNRISKTTYFTLCNFIRIILLHSAYRPIFSIFNFV